MKSTISNLQHYRQNEPEIHFSINMLLCLKKQASRAVFTTTGELLADKEVKAF